MVFPNFNVKTLYPDAYFPLAPRTVELKLGRSFERHGMEVIVEKIDTAPCLLGPGGYNLVAWYKSNNNNMTWSLPLTGTNNPSPQEFAEVRDWNKLLPNSMTLKNAFVNRKPKDGEEVTKVPQSFTYLCRSGRFESQAIQFSKYE